MSHSSSSSRSASRKKAKKGRGAAAFIAGSVSRYVPSAAVAVAAAPVAAPLAALPITWYQPARPRDRLNDVPPYPALRYTVDPVTPAVLQKFTQTKLSQIKGGSKAVPVNNASGPHSRYLVNVGGTNRVLTGKEWAVAAEEFYRRLLLLNASADKVLILEDVRVHCLGLDASALSPNDKLYKEAYRLVQGNWSDFYVSSSKGKKFFAYSVLGRHVPNKSDAGHVDSKKANGARVYVKVRENKQGHVTAVRSFRSVQASSWKSLHLYEFLVEDLLPMMQLIRFPACKSQGFVRCLIHHFKEFIRIPEFLEVEVLAVFNDLIDALTPASDSRANAYSGFEGGLRQFMLGKTTSIKSGPLKSTSKVVRCPWGVPFATKMVHMGFFADTELTTQKNAKGKRVTLEKISQQVVVDPTHYQNMIEKGYAFFSREVEAFERVIQVDAGPSPIKKGSPLAPSTDNLLRHYHDQRSKAEAAIDKSFNAWLAKNKGKPLSVALFSNKVGGGSKYGLSAGSAPGVQQAVIPHDFSESAWHPDKAGSRPMWANMLVWLGMVSGCRRIELVKWSDFGYVTKQAYLATKHLWDDPLLPKLETAGGNWDDEAGAVFRHYIIQYGIGKQGTLTENKTDRSKALVNEKMVIRPLLGTVTGYDFWRIHRMMIILFEQHLRYRYFLVKGSSKFSNKDRPLSDSLLWTDKSSEARLRKEMDLYMDDQQTLVAVQAAAKRSKNQNQPVVSSDGNDVAEYENSISKALAASGFSQKGGVPMICHYLTNASVSSLAMNGGGNAAVKHIMTMYGNQAADGGLQWKQLRAVYANMAYWTYGKQKNVSPAFFISRVLGHSFADVDTAKFYTTVHISEQNFSVTHPDYVLYFEAMSQYFATEKARLRGLQKEAAAVVDDLSGVRDELKDLAETTRLIRDGAVHASMLSRADRRKTQEATARKVFQACQGGQQTDITCAQGHKHSVTGAFAELASGRFWREKFHFSTRWASAYSHGKTDSTEQAFIDSAEKYYADSLAAEPAKKKQKSSST